MKRRNFIKTAGIASSLSLFTAPIFSASAFADRKFKIALNPGIIGVKANQQEAIDYAIQYGYEAVTPYINEVKNYSPGQLDELLAKMEINNLSWDSVNVPVEYRRSKNQFNEEFKGLRSFTETMEKIGATRINTWIISTHPDLTYNENMRQHAYRLGECARVMKDHGIRFGLEYLGMRTLMTAQKYPFIGSMKEGKELIAEIGESNVGFVLDSFHWYCADDTIEDIRTLTSEDIITVDLNDAREGFTRISQQDGKRELPLATGIINIKDFLQGLIDIDYGGPVRTEPFNQQLNEMDNDEALQTNMEAIKRTLELVGLS